VKLNYHPVYSLDDAVKVFEEESMKKDENDFVEGLLFSADQAVIMTGNFSSTCEPGKVSLIFLFNMIASNLCPSPKALY
jgi:delta24-sterol reductase